MIKKTYTLDATTTSVTLQLGGDLHAGSIILTWSGAAGALDFDVKANNRYEAPFRFTTILDSTFDDDGMLDIAGLVAESLKLDGDDVHAAVTSGNAETYALTDGWTLTVKIDQGIEDTATFNTADFVDIGNALAQEVADVINEDIAGCTATVDSSDKVVITSDAHGKGGYVEVTGGTANATIGFPTSEVQGTGPDWGSDTLTADVILKSAVEDGGP